MKLLIAIRHGSYKEESGDTGALTPEGVAQAYNLKNVLKTIPFLPVTEEILGFSSNVWRAEETLTRCAYACGTIVTMEDLRKGSYGLQSDRTALIWLLGRITGHSMAEGAGCAFVVTHGTTPTLLTMIALTQTGGKIPPTLRARQKVLPEPTSGYMYDLYRGDTFAIGPTGYELLPIA